jgi:putative Mn2+ efflux pump MntP
MEEVKNEQEQIVEVEEKKGFSKKKLFAIGGSILLAAIGVGALILKGGKNESEDNTVEVIDAAFEPVEVNEPVNE